MGDPDKIRNIGILGGTFDPVHKGHLAVARMALNRCQLDEILFTPAFSPPHKDRHLTSFAHRVAMLEAALKGEEAMAVSLVEAERTTPSYTAETLAELHRRLASSHFYLIMGADMFVEIGLWYRYRQLFELADIIVAARPGITADRVAGQVDGLPGIYNYNSQQQMWWSDNGSRIFYCPDIAESVSSSEVRSRLLRGSSVKAYLPQPVREYILHYRLYTPCGAEG